MFQNVIVGWFTRRGLELGGIFGILWTIYANLPPASQNAIERLMTGQWQEVTLGALAPLGIAVFGYLWSFRSTVKPQVVTTDAKQITLPKHAEATELVEDIAKRAKANLPYVKPNRDRLVGRAQ